MMNLKLTTVASFKYRDLEIHDCHREDDERLSHLGLITRADQNRLAAFERHIRKQSDGHCMCQQCEEILRWGKIWVVCYKKEIQSMKIRRHCQSKLIVLPGKRLTKSTMSPRPPPPPTPPCPHPGQASATGDYFPFSCFFLKKKTNSHSDLCNSAESSSSTIPTENQTLEVNKNDVKK